MFQLHLSDHQFNCLLKCAVCQRLDGNHSSGIWTLPRFWPLTLITRAICELINKLFKFDRNKPTKTSLCHLGCYMAQNCDSMIYDVKIQTPRIYGRLCHEQITVKALRCTYVKDFGNRAVRFFKTNQMFLWYMQSIPSFLYDGRSILGVNIKIKFYHHK